MLPPPAPAKAPPLTSAQPVRDDFRVEPVVLPGDKPAPLSFGTVLLTLFMGLAATFSTAALSATVVALLLGRIGSNPVTWVIIGGWSIIPAVVTRRWWRSVRAADRSTVHWSGLAMPFFLVVGLSIGLIVLYAGPL